MNSEFLGALNALLVEGVVRRLKAPNEGGDIQEVIHGV